MLCTKAHAGWQGASKSNTRSLQGSIRRRYHKKPVGERTGQKAQQHTDDGKEGTKKVTGGTRKLWAKISSREEKKTKKLLNDRVSKEGKELSPDRGGREGGNQEEKVFREYQTKTGSIVSRQLGCHKRTGLQNTAPEGKAEKIKSS